MVGRRDREELSSHGDPPTGIPRDEGEEDLTRLLASAHPPVAPSAGFKERLFRQLAAQVRKEAPGRVTDRLAGFLRGMATAGQTPARHLVLAAAVTAAVFIAVMGGRLVRQATAPLLVTLAMEEGTSQVVRPGGRFLGLGGPQALTVDAGEELALKTGDEIITGPDSKGLLRLSDGSSLELAPGTWLSLFQATPAEGEPRLALEIRVGETFAHIAPGSFASQGGFVIRTPSAKVIALSRTFGLRVVTPSHTFLSVDEGLVHLTAGDEVAEVYAGEEVDIQVGQPLMVRAREPRTEIAQAYSPLCTDRVMVSGHVTAGDSVELFLNGIQIATVNADAEGRFAYPIETTQEGIYAVSARSTNQQGHRSAGVILREFAIDCSPPPLAIIEPWDPEVDSSRVVLTGRTEPGTQVKIGEEHVTVDSEGVFSAILELVPGGNPLTITATDKAGNTLTIYPVLIL